MTMPNSPAAALNGFPFARTAAQSSPFPINSRYYGIALAERLAPDGTILVHLCRRFVPAVDPLAPVQEHVVVTGERLDHIAARYFGDPELSWRLCDTNGVLLPRELVAAPGRAVRIPLPEVR
jgi:hypothetical protein